jgi:hypothetical protein
MVVYIRKIEGIADSFEASYVTRTIGRANFLRYIVIEQEESSSDEEQA